MKRLMVFVASVALLAGMLVAPVTASALVATPPDGAKVALTAYGSTVYEYPVGSGTWYFDGGVGNWSASTYADGVTVVRPTVTLEYLDAASLPVGTETFEVDVNVMPFNTGGGDPMGAYYHLFHRRLAGMPVGADPTKTRIMPEVAPSDPAWPKYQYGIAAKTLVHQLLPTVPGPVDSTTLGDGRIQYVVTVTNDTLETVGPVRFWGNENAGVSNSSNSMLDVYEVTPLEPAKAKRLAPGESTTFQVRGLAPTPLGLNRYSDWNRYAEAEPLTNLTGIVSSNWAREGGTTVSVPDCEPVVTAADGSYTVPYVLPGTYQVTFTKPGFQPTVRTVTVSYAGDTVCHAQLIKAAVPLTPGRPRVSGKATAKRGTLLKGSIAPSYGQVTIEVQVLSKKKYKKYKTFYATSTMTGEWSKKIKIKKGTYRVRVTTRAWEAYFAGVSSWRTFKVK